MELKHGILNEEEKVALQIRQLEKAKEDLAAEITELRDEQERGSDQMKIIKREEIEAISLETQLCHLTEEVRVRNGQLGDRRARIEFKQGDLISKSQLLDEKELELQTDTHTFKKEEEAIDQDIA